MRVLILGGDGYLGWPTAMHFSARGDNVMVVDNFAKRKWELEEGFEPLMPIPNLHRRIEAWKEISGKEIKLEVADICNHRVLYNITERFHPDTIIHYGEQPSAPYSMESRERCVYTQINNITGTLNLLFAIQRNCPDAHLIKLGTMGEYGTPNIDIEEGWLDVTHNGREDRVLFPKKPGSFYHLSKVHDSHNIEYACRTWDIRATDLNQGVVYGIDTEHTQKLPDLKTSFHYDSIFGTVLNRFLVQSAVGAPLTVYGKGGQTRGFLNIKDTIQCVELAADNPADRGQFRVFNQFTEQFSINDLAKKVAASAKRFGYKCEINNIKNPRVEKEEHYYNAKHTKLADLGLKPNLLTDETMDEMFTAVKNQCEKVNLSAFNPTIRWRGGTSQIK